MRILIADDDSATRFMLKDITAQWGYDVVEAADGQEAYSVLSGQDSPQLALLDWMMPGMDGPEICSRVRQADGLLFIYMIILTIKSEKKDLAAALDAGADDFLSKPVDYGELRSRLAVGSRAVDYERRLAGKNRQLDEYANRMEELAEERARQLFHAERLSMLGALTAGIAHEMANPLGYISGNIGLLEMDWEVAMPCIRDAIARGGKNEKPLDILLQETPARFGQINNGIDRCVRFLDNLRRFSRKDHGLKSACAVNECIENALRLSGHRLKYDIIVNKDLGSGLPLLYASPLQLEQVFLNLVVNAADAMAASGGGTLRIVSRQAEDKIVVTVEDTGCGIPEGHADSIWEPFFTTKDMDKGTGLGLSISRGIVEDHKGKIRAENKADGGARFIVELPVSASE